MCLCLRLFCLVCLTVFFWYVIRCVYLCLHFVCLFVCVWCCVLFSVCVFYAVRCCFVAQFSMLFALAFLKRKEEAVLVVCYLFLCVRVVGLLFLFLCEFVMLFSGVLNECVFSVVTVVVAVFSNVAVLFSLF